MLDIVPAQLRVRVIRRPRYGCRTCEAAVVQAPAPERPITGGMATGALLAQVLVAEFCDHLHLYRQAQIFARQGIELDRSTLSDWGGRTCWWLEPLGRRLSPVATARLNRVEPLAWLTDALERMVAGRAKATDLARLLPWLWQAERVVAATKA
jgi:transposase